MPSIIAPYPMRSIVSDESGTLRITIPMRKRLVLLFLSAWLGLWTVGGIAIGKQLRQKFNLFEAFWMCGWVMGEVMASYALLRMLGGRDIVQVSNGVLELRTQAFGLGFSKQYSILEIRDLRFQPETGGGKSNRDSCIAFDYGAKTITFGDGVDESEANQLIRTILDRHPSIQSSPAATPSKRFWQAN